MLTANGKALTANLGITPTGSLTITANGTYDVTDKAHVIVKREYKAQDNPVGAADNSIPWAEDVPCIPNAYYIYNGVRKVWMGEPQDGADWDDNNFVTMEV